MGGAEPTADGLNSCWNVWAETLLQIPRLIRCGNPHLH